MRCKAYGLIRRLWLDPFSILPVYLVKVIENILDTAIDLSTGQEIRQDKGYPMDNLDEQDYFIFHHGKSYIYNKLDNTTIICLLIQYLYGSVASCKFES